MKTRLAAIGLLLCVLWMSAGSAESTEITVTSSQTAQTLVVLDFGPQLSGTETRLPSSLKRIEAEAFAGNTHLEKLYFTGNSVESIGSRAFAGCRNLIEVHFPDNVGTIADDAFTGCTYVTFVCSETCSARAYAEAHGIPVRNE